MNNPVFVIAEAGVNHGGSLERALQLVDVAADVGADAVKFQTFRSDQLATVHAKKAGYQLATTGDGESQREMLRKLELSESDHHALVARCRNRGIRFMSTAFDAQSLAFLSSLGMPAIKIPSGDITCGPLLLQAARIGRPMIISTGMATLAEVELALGVVAFGLTMRGHPVARSDCESAYISVAGRRALGEKVTLLHCVSAYPAPPAAVNLRAIGTLRAAFGLPVGYSDHTSGIEVALAAVALGATVIEKHFTLDRRLPGPDHAASLEPQDLDKMIKGIRSVEAAMGSEYKGPAAEELANRVASRRSVVAARRITRGEIFEANMLAMKRPGGGISPMDCWELMGRSAHRDYVEDELIDL